MPTYEYECKKCRHRFEVFQSINDDPVKDCPKCGKEIRRIIFGGAGVIFKGSGFYVTDKNKSPSGPKTRKPPDSAAKDGTSPDSPKSEPAASGNKNSGESKGQKNPAADSPPHTAGSNSAKRTA